MVKTVKNLFLLISMNKEFKFIYTCSDIARLWSGTVKLVGKEDTDAKKDALNYLHSQYKDSNCRIFNQKIKDSDKNDSITHIQKDMLYTAVFYK